MSNPQKIDQPEPWLRGTLVDLPAEQRAVIHALQLAQEDIERWCGTLTQKELSTRPHGLPSVAFHLRHIVGSLDRLLTYAKNKALTDEQKRWMTAEMDGPVHREELLAAFQHGMTMAETRIRAIDTATWQEARGVGRKQLPASVAGLVIHCAEHTQRHVGQAVTTTKILLALREQATT